MIGEIVVGIFAFVVGFGCGVASQSRLVAEYQGWNNRLAAEKAQLHQIIVDIKKAV